MYGTYVGIQNSYMCANEGAAPRSAQHVASPEYLPEPTRECVASANRRRAHAQHSRIAGVCIEHSDSQVQSRESGSSRIPADLSQLRHERHAVKRQVTTRGHSMDHGWRYSSRCGVTSLCRVAGAAQPNRC